MAMRAWRAAANANSTLSRASLSRHPLIAKNAMSGAPAFSFSAAGSTVWTAVGPAPLASDATGDGGQDYSWVSGRATSVLIDPADSSGNTVLLGGAYGGLWKSTNAGNQSSSPASVTWQALIDDQATLAVGAIALQPGDSNVILVGTGETNSSGDSYYGLGILRSADGGSTWTQITGIGQTPDRSLMGIGFSKIAFGGTANPNLVVAASAGDNGLCLGEEAATAGGSGPCLGPQEDGNSPVRGLYYSTNAGVTWNRATLTDGSIAASATSVIYNPSQGTNGTFYAFIRRHGLYSSTDGINFALATQPTAGLTPTNCPVSSNATTCPIYRGELAVVPGRNEMYAWVVDGQYDFNGIPTPVDDGIWQSLNGGASWTQIPDNGITNCGDVAGGCGVEQGWYNLALAAIPDGTTATDVYAGAVNLYKCTLASGSAACTQTNNDWINLTHVYGCSPLAAPAHVHPNQHGIAFTVAGTTTPGYFAHDGGISRTLDGYAGLETGSCSGTNQFDSLSQTLGSMTEFVSISADPTDADILLGGTQGNGSPKTSTTSESSTWQNALGGDGGFTAINPVNSSEWFAANPYVTILKCESGTACNDTSFFQVVDSSDLGGDQGAFETPYILDPQNASEMLVGTCRVWQIGTGGTAPLQLSNDFDTLGTGVCTGGETNLVTALAAGGAAPNGYSAVVYAVTDGYGPLSGAPGGKVWVTTNAGVSLMTNVTGNVNPNGYAISSVAMDSSDATGKTAYVGIMGFSTTAYPTSHVWKTTNAGATWTDWSGAGATELPDAPVNALLVDSTVTPSQIYAGTDVGVFVSSTSAPSWTEVGPAPGPGVSGFLPDAPVTALRMFNPDAGTKALVAATYGRGIWNYALVTAPDYTNVVSNSPQTVFPTQTATFDGTLTALGGYSSAVNLSCTGAAPATCTLNPKQATPTATYTLTAGGSVGDYSFNAHAVGTDPDAITRDATVTLHVVDFNLTAPSPNSLSVAQGGTSAASTFQVTASGSFAGTVALGCPAGLPTGASCVFSPSSSVSPTSFSPVTVTLTVTAGAGTPLGGPLIVTLAATAAGAPAAKTQTFGLTVMKPAPNFTIAVTATPNTAAVNQNVTWNGTLTAVGGYSGSVTLTCTVGAPETCEITPSTLTPTAGGAAFTVTLGNATPGTFNFTIQGTDGTLTNSTPTETLTVTGAADFAIAVTPTPNAVGVSPQSVVWYGTLTALNGYIGNVTLSCTAGAPGICIPTGPVTPTVTGARFGVTLGSATAGTFNFTISGTDGTLTHATPTETLTVTGPAADFTIAVTATPNTTVVNQNVTWYGTLTAVSGYSGSVTLTCTAGAPGTCGITPSTLTPTAGGAAFTVTVGNATAGAFNFAIQGTDGTLTHATPTETLTVTGPAADFTWTDTGSASATVLAGQSASYTFSAAPVGGGTFSTAVGFGCSNLPALTSCGFHPASIAAGAGTTAITLTISTTGPNLGTGSQSRRGAVLRTAWTAGDGRPYASATRTAGGSRPHASRRPYALSFFTLAWVALVGMVGVRRKRRGSPRLYRWIAVLCLGLGLTALISCGGVGGGSGTAPPVTVSPGLATLFADEAGNLWPVGVSQQQFTANQSVTWAVTGGNANGTVDGTGLYTAPALVPGSGTVTVTATSATSAGSAFVTVAAPTALGTSQITVTATAAGGAAHGDVVALTVQ